MSKDTLTSWLGEEIDLLCLDAGNTVVFLDHVRLAASTGRAGFEVTAEALMRAEDEAMRAIFRGEALAVDWSRAAVPAARGWGVMVGTLLVRAGADRAKASELLDALWEEHLAFNFWSRVADGLVDALEDARSTGLRTVIVSNSEGEASRRSSRTSCGSVPACSTTWSTAASSGSKSRTLASSASRSKPPECLPDGRCTSETATPTLEARWRQECAWPSSTRMGAWTVRIRRCHGQRAPSM